MSDRPQTPTVVGGYVGLVIYAVFALASVKWRYVDSVFTSPIVLTALAPVIVSLGFTYILQYLVSMNAMLLRIETAHQAGSATSSDD